MGPSNLNNAETQFLFFCGADEVSNELTVNALEQAQQRANPNTEDYKARFDTTEKIFDFVVNDRNLLTLSAANADLGERIINKLDEAINAEKARENDDQGGFVNVMRILFGQFFHKLGQAVRGHGWKLESEWAESVRNEFARKASGKYNKSEMREIFAIPMSQLSHRKLACQAISQLTVDQVKEYTREDVWGFIKKTVGRANWMCNFVAVIYSALGSDEKKAAFANALLDAGNYPLFSHLIELKRTEGRPVTEKEHPRSEEFVQFIRSLPLGKYLAMKKLPFLTKDMKLSDIDIEMTILLFVNSIKENNNDDCVVAEQILRHAAKSDVLNVAKGLGYKHKILTQAEVDDFNMYSPYI